MKTTIIYCNISYYLGFIISFRLTKKRMYNKNQNMYFHVALSSEIQNARLMLSYTYLV